MLSQYDSLFSLMFICVLVIQMSKIYIIKDKKSSQWLSVYVKLESKYNGFGDLNEQNIYNKR